MFLSYLSIFHGFLWRASQKETQKQEIKVAYAETIPKGNERSYTFLSEPYRTTELSFRVGRSVTTFDVQNEQFFKKGELIASIDDRDLSSGNERRKPGFIRRMRITHVLVICIRKEIYREPVMKRRKSTMRK